MESKTIVTYQEPLRINISDWLNENIGRVSVGEKLNSREVLIYAYSDNKKDSKQLTTMAKEHHWKTLRSFQIGDITSFEEYKHNS